MGGNTALLRYVIVGLSMVMLATFVLRPSSARRGFGWMSVRVLFYAMRVAVVVFALILTSRGGRLNGWHFPWRASEPSSASTSDDSDPFADDSIVTDHVSDPFADDTAAAGSATGKGGASKTTVSGEGPKVMEFDWATTKPSR